MSFAVSLKRMRLTNSFFFFLLLLLCLFNLHYFCCEPVIERATEGEERKNDTDITARLKDFEEFLSSPSLASFRSFLSAFPLNSFRVFSPSAGISSLVWPAASAADSLFRPSSFEILDTGNEPSLKEVNSSGVSIDCLRKGASKVAREVGRSYITYFTALYYPTPLFLVSLPITVLMDYIFLPFYLIVFVKILLLGGTKLKLPFAKLPNPPKQFREVENLPNIETDSQKYLHKIFNMLMEDKKLREFNALLNQECYLSRRSRSNDQRKSSHEDDLNSPDFAKSMEVFRTFGKSLMITGM